MQPGDIIAAASGSTVIGSIITWLLTRGIIKRKQDHKEGSDARADWARFAGKMDAALGAERARSEAQAERIDRLREHLDTADRRYRDQGDHIDILEAHIWAKKPPPPPARPEGI